jgi:hypothetical protein
MAQKKLRGLLAMSQYGNCDTSMYGWKGLALELSRRRFDRPHTMARLTRSWGGSSHSVCWPFVAPAWQRESYAASGRSYNMEWTRPRATAPTGGKSPFVPARSNPMP